MLAKALAKRLQGGRSGNSWMARCPARHDPNPSLAIREAEDGHLLVFCHAGCSQDRALPTLSDHGLWRRDGRKRCAVKAASGRGRRQDRACSLWQSAAKATGTLVQNYLASRGLRLAPKPASSSLPWWLS
jgi:hypothetical protein